MMRGKRTNEQKQQHSAMKKTKKPKGETNDTNKNTDKYSVYQNVQ